jgi:hypothetical protein
MKKIFLLFMFLLSAELCVAHRDSVEIKQPKTAILADTTVNDGWGDSWSPEPLPQEETTKTKKEKKAEKKQARQEKREANPSNFPRGVAWSSVALAALGIIKILVSNCK